MKKDGTKGEKIEGWRMVREVTTMIREMVERQETQMEQQREMVEMLQWQEEVMTDMSGRLSRQEEQIREIIMGQRVQEEENRVLREEYGVMMTMIQGEQRGSEGDGESEREGMEEMDMMDATGSGSNVGGRSASTSSLGYSTPTKRVGRG
jgi:hypothetical protein